MRRKLGTEMTDQARMKMGLGSTPKSFSFQSEHDALK